MKKVVWKALVKMYDWDSYQDEGVEFQSDFEEDVDEILNTPGLRIGRKDAEEAVRIHEVIHGRFGNIEGLNRLMAFIEATKD